RSFFYSSRRRHTRSKRDWSSDVCSSDLRFELRKIYEQKRWLLLVLIVLVSMSGFLWQNISEKSAKQERALEIIEPYVGENQRIQNPLLTMEESLNEAQEIQLEYSHEMARMLVQWSKAIDQ